MSCVLSLSTNNYLSNQQYYVLCLFTELRSNEDVLLKMVAPPSDWSEQACNTFPYSTRRALNADFRRRIQRLVGG